LAADPYKYFRIESRELLDLLTRGVLDLDKGAAPAEVVGALLRHAHTLKGAARVVRQPEIADQAHAMEETLEPFRESTEPVPVDRLEVLLALLDAIGERIARLPLPQSEVAGTVQRAQPEAPARLVRTELAEIDLLLDGVGEAKAQLGVLQSEVHRIEQLRELATIITSQLTSSVATADLLGVVSTLERSLKGAIERLDRELADVREGVEHLRLVPANAIFVDLERAVRDVAKAQSKSVAFTGLGGDVRLDADLLAAAQGAIQQVVRNAVVHGIETEDERRSRGKMACGQVTVEVARHGRRAVFTCSDDGRGIDLDAVREVARRKGLLADDVASLSTSELVELLLRGGLSTADTVTELSGRGIGLDIVRDFAARMGGEVTVTTEAGQGTVVRVEVAVSLVSFQALMVESEAATVLIPLDAVIQTVSVVAGEIHAGPHGETLTHEGEVIPFLQLSELLSGGAVWDRPRGRRSVLIISSGSSLAAIGVRRLRGISEIIVRPLPSLIPGSEVISGVWLDGEGNPQLVLDPEGLVAAARRDRGGVVRVVEEASLSPVLVIDDSLTTRMLEQSILESAGYAVEVASSAEEGLAKVSTRPYLLVLVDVEMPGMDGFGFVERIKADPKFRDLPAILVSSRSAPEDIQRGLDAGASDYFTKGEFDQGKLLERIRELTVR
jgi:two-component system chemotaxis sensor kinase CheA